MPQKTLLLLLTVFLALCPLFLQAKEPDPVLQTIEKAIGKYQNNDFSNAASSLDYASQLIRQKKGEALAKLLPTPLQHSSTLIQDFIPLLEPKT